MLISSESSRVPVRIYSQAEQLARNANQITKDLLNVEIPLRDIQCKVAGLVKDYTGLFGDLGRRDELQFWKNINR